MPPSSMAMFLYIRSYTHSPDCCTENLCECVAIQCVINVLHYYIPILNCKIKCFSQQSNHFNSIRRWWWCYWNYKENWNAAMWSLTLTTKLNCSLQCLAEASEMYNTDSTTWQESVHFSNLIFFTHFHNV